MLVALSAASFGMMPIFAKMAYSAGTSTYTLLFLRFLVGTAFMFLLLAVKKIPLPSKKRNACIFCTWRIGLCRTVLLLFHGIKLCVVKYGFAAALYISRSCYAGVCFRIQGKNHMEKGSRTLPCASRRICHNRSKVQRRRYGNYPCLDVCGVLLNLHFPLADWSVKCKQTSKTIQNRLLHWLGSLFSTTPYLNHFPPANDHG